MSASDLKEQGAALSRQESTAGVLRSGPALATASSSLRHRIHQSINNREPLPQPAPHRPVISLTYSHAPPPAYPPPATMQRRKGMQVRHAGVSRDALGVWRPAGAGMAAASGVPARSARRHHLLHLPKYFSPARTPPHTDLPPPTRPQQVTNINTPRTIRSRLSFPRRKAPATDAAIAEAPAQQVARSNSGKAAMG